MILVRNFALVALLALTPVPVFAQMMPQPTPDADALAAAIRRLGPNPRDLDALIVAGELSLKLGDASAAASLFKRAEMLDPMNGRVKAGMARILVQEERPGEALRYFDQAIGYGLDPRSFAGDRGLAYDLIGEQDRAQRDYRLALKAGPNDEVVRRYALSLGISGKRDAALEQIDTLLRKADRGAWRGRAFILAMTGDVPGASDVATKMMPGAMASGLQPFFVMLPKLSAIDRAFAVHFGEVRSTPQRLADARLAPALPVLLPEPGVALAAAKPVLRVPKVESARDRRARRAQERDRSRKRSEPVQVAVAQAAPVPLPPPPSLPRLPVFAPRAEVVQAVPARADPVVASAQVAAAVVTAPSVVQTPPVQAATTQTPAAAVQIAAAPSARGPVARIYGPPAPTPTVASQPSVVAGSTSLGAGFSSVPTNVAAATATASELPVPEPSTPTPTPTPTPTATPTATATATPTPTATPSIAASIPTLVSPAPVAAAVAAPVSIPAPAPTPSVVPKVAEPVPPVAVVARAGPAKMVVQAKDDSILARIMAGISIPASELEVQPVQAMSVPPPVVAAAPAVPKPLAKPVPPGLVAKTKPVPATPTAAETRAAEKKALADRKVATDKKLADAKKAAEAKVLAEEKRLAKTDPPRIWVQVSGGANESDLPKAWGSVKAKASALNGRQAYSTPLRATNRVVTGPFRTDAEARALINQLAKQGVSAFSFTSAKGQKMKQLGGK